MELELLLQAKTKPMTMGPLARGRNLFTDGLIVLVRFWTVIYIRAVSWGCVVGN